MKPVVGAMNAWTCIVISVFAVIILGIIGSLFSSDYKGVMGNEEAPNDNVAIATTIFSAVAVYAGFLVFCGFQAFLHYRQSRSGQISLQ